MASNGRGIVTIRLPPDLRNVIVNIMQNILQRTYPPPCLRHRRLACQFQWAFQGNATMTMMVFGVTQGKIAVMAPDPIASPTDTAEAKIGLHVNPPLYSFHGSS
jgi:hypothetical protein